MFALFFEYDPFNPTLGVVVYPSRDDALAMAEWLWYEWPYADHWSRIVEVSCSPSRARELAGGAPPVIPDAVLEPYPMQPYPVVGPFAV